MSLAFRNRSHLRLWFVLKFCFIVFHCYITSHSQSLLVLLGWWQPGTCCQIGKTKPHQCKISCYQLLLKYILLYYSLFIKWYCFSYSKLIDNLDTAYMNHVKSVSKGLRCLNSKTTDRVTSTRVICSYLLEQIFVTFEN